MVVTLPRNVVPGNASAVTPISDPSRNEWSAVSGTPNATRTTEKSASETTAMPGAASAPSSTLRDNSTPENGATMDVSANGTCAWTSAADAVAILAFAASI